MAGGHATEAELPAHCRARLAAFEVPGRVPVVEDVPRTATGDGDRRAPAALFAPPAPAR